MTFQIRMLLQKMVQAFVRFIRKPSYAHREEARRARLDFEQINAATPYSNPPHLLKEGE